ncbi:MAG: SGNH/GDSL hydrolase family protein [Ruminococcus sp.]|nr:SGNH/GDSL hydrolase family protein [Ruminococcus sp.]
MKKIFALALAFVMAAAVLASCGSEDSSAASSKSSGTASTAEDVSDAGNGDSAEEPDESSEDTPADNGSDLKAPVNDGPIDVTKGCTENMLIRSVHFEGDTTRLAAKLKEAKDPDVKKMTNIVFLGDSITAGSTVSNSKFQYVKQFENWWKDNVGVLYRVYNAGIGATDSYYGVHRVDRDVLSYEPDIIVIEFINDAGGGDFYKAAMESLVRKCLAYETKPAVILLEMSLEGGSNAQEAHAAVGEKYNVPVLSYHDAVNPEIEAGNLTFTSSKRKPSDTDGISSDGTHPNDCGHTMVFEILSNFISGVMDKLDTIDTTDVPAFDPDSESIAGDIYKNAKVSDSSTGDVEVNMGDNFTDTTTPWNFQNGWSTGKGGTIEFEMEFRNLGMCYYKTTNGKTGAATVSVDGAEVAVVDGDFSGGWGDYGASVEVYRSEETAKHKVTVTVPEGERDDFEVLAWLVS